MEIAEVLQQCLLLRAAALEHQADSASGRRTGSDSAVKSTLCQGVDVVFECSQLGVIDRVKHAARYGRERTLRPRERRKGAGYSEGN